LVTIDAREMARKNLKSMGKVDEKKTKKNGKANAQTEAEL